MGNGCGGIIFAAALAMTATMATLIPGVDARCERLEPLRLLRGTAGDDELVGTQGNDVVRGRAGNDCIVAGPGRDRVFAGPVEAPAIRPRRSAVQVIHRPDHSHTR